MDRITLEYLGHSCFAMTCGDYRTILDPYADGSVPGWPLLREKANAAYCSHEHGDHFGAENVEILPGTAPYTVTELLTDHDEQGGTQRGKNTVRIFQFGDLRLAHMGDIGRSLTEQERSILMDVDCMLIPVGGFFTIDAAQAKEMADSVHAKVVIPMHFRKDSCGYGVIAPVEDFLRQYPSHNEGTVLELTKETPAQVLLLRSR